MYIHTRGDHWYDYQWGGRDDIGHGSEKKRRRVFPSDHSSIAKGPWRRVFRWWNPLVNWLGLGPVVNNKRFRFRFRELTLFLSFMFFCFFWQSRLSGCSRGPSQRTVPVRPGPPIQYRNSTLGGDARAPLTYSFLVWVRVGLIFFLNHVYRWLDSIFSTLTRTRVVYLQWECQTRSLSHTHTHRFFFLIFRLFLFVNSSGKKRVWGSRMSRVLLWKLEAYVSLEE
jgi:hypothetical protein